MVEGALKRPLLTQAVRPRTQSGVSGEKVEGGRSEQGQAG